MIRPLRFAGTVHVLGAGLLGGFLSLAGCGDGNEWRSVKKESAEAWDSAKAWGVARRREAETFYSKSMDALPRHFEDAKTKASAAGGEASRALDAEWVDVSRKLAAMKAASADAWDGARVAFVKAYESLRSGGSSGR